jgi:hypothetical protein
MSKLQEIGKSASNICTMAINMGPGEPQKEISILASLIQHLAYNAAHPGDPENEAAIRALRQQLKTARE